MSGNADGCSEFRALASCHLDGELDELQATRLERHLLTCAACRTWTSEVAVVAGMLHEPEVVSPWSFEPWGRAMRRRFVRTATVAATAASAAAIAAFVVTLPGNRLSFFSPGSAHAASPAPCVSCTKKQALTFGASVVPAAIAGPVHHVVNPLVEQPE